MARGEPDEDLSHPLDPLLFPTGRPKADTLSAVLREAFRADKMATGMLAFSAIAHVLSIQISLFILLVTLADPTDCISWINFALFALQILLAYLSLKFVCVATWLTCYRLKFDMGIDRLIDLLMAYRTVFGIRPFHCPAAVLFVAFLAPQPGAGLDAVPGSCTWGGSFAHSWAPIAAQLLLAGALCGPYLYYARIRLPVPMATILSASSAPFYPPSVRGDEERETAFLHRGRLPDTVSQRPAAAAAAATAAAAAPVPGAEGV